MGVMPPPNHSPMFKDIVIEGEAMIGLCVLLVLVLFAQYAYNKAYGSIEERTQDTRWWIQDPSPCGIEAGTPDTIACEGCGRHTPTHIWEMLGYNCFYGTCVGGRWLLEEWMRLYQHAIDIDNRFMLNELQAGFNNINHNEHLGIPDGHVCEGCGGINGDPEPEDMTHPYYNCVVCAGGS